MIDYEIAAQLAAELGVSPEVIMMEACQMTILENIAAVQLSKRLIFKGGTSLRLAHQSFRFSEDLDFSILKQVSFPDFKKLMTAIAKKNPETKLEEVFNMKETLFAKFSVSGGGRKTGIKIEISKRREVWHSGKDYRLTLLQSPASNLTPLIYSATLERIYSDKLKAIKNRQKPRDWFDLWFLSQKLNKKWQGKIPLSKKLMLDRVRFLLPKAKRLILEEFDYEN